ncbi:MAG: Adenine DNA glycosylase [Chlamydiia bacterium]|nr:Adenine DNA glycosylase [Chlamydiia bacterium]
MDDYAKALSDWFKDEKRDFPWRNIRTSYSVLVSEIMLQQTVASVVVSYFNRWMKLFPDFEVLAKASEEEVIKAWEGLGYYSRARNLHTIAKKVVSDFGGTFPAEIDQILSFKGIGPYTSAALSHFAFNKRALGCDGNIKKVLSRFYGHKGYIENDKEFIEFLEQFLPQKDSSHCFEGLIELGATTCLKKPKCDVCPLRGGCKAYSEGLQEVIPLRKKREKIIKLHRTVFVLINKNRILIKKGQKKLMKDLHEFPYVEHDGAKEVSMLTGLMEKELGCSIDIKKELAKVSHSFTKYKAFLTSFVGYAENIDHISSEYLFVSFDQIGKYSFSSGHRRILNQL